MRVILSCVWSAAILIYLEWRITLWVWLHRQLRPFVHVPVTFKNSGRDLDVIFVSVELKLHLSCCGPASQWDMLIDTHTHTHLSDLTLPVSGASCMFQSDLPLRNTTQRSKPFTKMSYPCALSTLSTHYTSSSSAWSPHTPLHSMCSEHTGTQWVQSRHLGWWWI